MKTSDLRANLAKIPRSIWMLGFVSMFMDISSEMIHALLPVYMASVLGISTLSIGFIEGIAEATAAITKIFSGALSDYLGRRKMLAVLGYGMAALTKPIFPLATTASWLIAARFIDRIGKGIRGAPRDALVGDIAPHEIRGACFGLRQSLDTVGAFIGPALAIILMLMTADAFKTVFWLAVIPAFIAVGLLYFGVDEPEQLKPAVQARHNPLKLSEIRKFGFGFWLVLAIATILTLARFSEAFLVLRGQAIGIIPAFIPFVLVVMNIVYAAAAYPAGILSDRLGRKAVFVLGIFLLIGADLILATIVTSAGLWLGIALWGLHMGFTQGLLSTLVTDHSPAELRGTAFGLLNLTGGIALLLASVIAGGLWDLYGPAMTFHMGAVLATVALCGLMLSGSRILKEGA